MRPVRVLDLACGGGDLAIQLAKIANRRGWPAQIDGADVSPTAVEYASGRANGTGARFRVLDALGGELPTDYDVITCTLFLHHLTSNQAVNLLRRAAGAARHALVVDDLVRSRAGHTLAWVGCRVLSRSPIVHNDGPVSVEGAFSIAEAKQMADQAGLVGAKVDRHWPERFQLVWERPA